MEKPHLNLEKPIKANPSEKPHKANKISITASIFFIFICLSLFHLSPSTVFKDTKFWFFISNAIILIVAADSGAFSSSKEKHDLYDEFLMNSRARNASSIVVELPENGVKEDVEKLEVTRSESETLRPNTCETSKENKAELGKEDKIHTKASGATNVIKGRCYRSKSEKATYVEGKKNKRILRRSETERREPRSEENEFSAMSNEELNRRVEEFIQRFNRQIRLQETRILV